MQSMFSFVSLSNALCKISDIDLLQSRISYTLFHCGLAFAYLVMAAILIWLMTRSMLLRRTRLMYVMTAFLMVNGSAHILDLLNVPLWAHLISQFSVVFMAILTALVLWMQKHYLLRVIYQFKYTIGLLKSIDIIDQVSRKSGDEK